MTFGIGNRYGRSEAIWCSQFIAARTDAYCFHFSNSGNNECFEPYTSNIYTRRTLSGEFIIVNKHLLKDLVKPVSGTRR
jgi:hypothetical protein